MNSLLDGRVRRALVLVLLVTVLSAPSEWPTDASTASTTLALVGGTIYTSPHVAPIFDGAVVIAEGKVVAVGPRKEVEIPAGAQTLECRGLVVTAGFQNSHVHFTEEKWNDDARQAPGKLGAQLAQMLTRYGFTTVVDTASPLENTAALRRRIEAGEVAGPRILTAGDGIYPPNGIPFYLKEGPGKLPDEVLGRLSQPASPEEATEVARQRIGGGADLIKLFTGSWVARGKVLPMPEEIASAAAEESHRQGKLVFSHPSNLAGLEVALRANVDVLAHAIEDTRGMTAEHIRRMREQGMALIPTLALFARDRYLFDILDEVRDYARSGGLILFGTDVGYLTDYDPSMEYALMESAGLGWREILASLTTQPAARFGEASRRGRIDRGMDADLVVLARDPVIDVRAFADVCYTLRAGKVIYSAAAGAPE